jgi:cytochrome c553
MMNRSKKRPACLSNIVRKCHRINVSNMGSYGELRSIIFWKCALWICLAGLATTSDPRPVAAAEEVVGIPALQRWPEAIDQGGPTARGEILWNELRCGACHRVPQAWQERLAVPQAPRLEGVSARARIGFLLKFLLDPAAVQPQTSMPKLLHGDESQRQQVALSLLHFLTSLGGPAQEALPIVGSGRRGEELFHAIGCAACHGDQHPQSPETPLAKRLDRVSDKYTWGGLSQFLADPLAVRPAARMPSLNLTTEEAECIAAFLLRLPELYRVRYAYYEGQWSALPDFDRLQPVEIGGAERIDLSVARRRDYFALRFEGNLRIEATNVYRFRLASDDGARLWINNQLVIDTDGVHPTQERQAELKLEAGIHAVRIDYFEHAGEEVLRCTLEGPGIRRQPLDRFLVGAKTQEQPTAVDRGQLALDVDTQLALEGKRHFVSLGCAACHLIQENGSRLEPEPIRPAPAADALVLDRGCLAAQPPVTVPHYRLSAEQVAALRELLQRMSSPPEPLSEPVQIQRTLAVFGCLACHERGGIGGVTPPYNSFFQTTTPEMGDEGRVPPPLNGVGGKLTQAWLRQTLERGAKERPYMLTRMPRFGLQALGDLDRWLTAVDALPPLEPVQFPVPLVQVKHAGWAMVGEGGFGCVKCHTFGNFPAQGIQAINLQLMHDRLRPEWFRRYMRNPAAFRPGTRMPSAWPPQGKSLLDYLNADSDLQVAAIWEYLSDGERARIPTGLTLPPMELVPVQTAIIYRNFIAGAGPRAIAVGFPEGIHAAFDADNMRLALLWQGRFLDASRHWTGRGEGFQPPAGENVLQLPDGPPLARLGDLSEPWPNQPAHQIGYRFRGYRTTPDGRPTFLYEAFGVRVEDHLDARNIGRTTPLPRVLRFQATEPIENLWLRPAVGSIQSQPGQKYLINGSWHLEVVAPQTGVVVRQSAGQDELLVPVVWSDGRGEIHLRYSW